MEIVFGLILTDTVAYTAWEPTCLRVLRSERVLLVSAFPSLTLV